MAFDFETPQPLAAAVAQISKKTPVGAALSSSQWAEQPAALRESAMFSARVESARAMQNVKDGLMKMLAMARDEQAKANAELNAGQPGAYQMDRSKFIAENQKLANALGLRTTDEKKRGSVQDFGSERRLKLIYEQQVGAAQAKAFYLQGQDPDVLNAWPAQELVRVSDRKKKRDWKTRWRDAAVAAGFAGVSRTAMAAGRFIALKTSPIWARLSRFGRPYPPFDYSSGMGVQEIDREEAVQLGLLKPGEVLAPTVQQHEDGLKASVAGIDADIVAALQKNFGNQLAIEGDEVKWTGGGTPEVKANVPPSAPQPDAVQEAEHGPPGEPIPQPPQNRRGAKIPRPPEKPPASSDVPPRVETTPSTEPVTPVKPPKPGRGIHTDQNRATQEEASHLNQREEIATIYGQDGKVVSQKKGDASSVEFTPEEMAQLGGAVLTHNHPAGNSFSDQDLAFAASADLAEMRVACGSHDGRARLYRLLRPENGWELAPNALLQAHDDAAKIVSARQREQIKAGKLSGRQARRVFAHEVMEELQRAIPAHIIYSQIEL